LIHAAQKRRLKVVVFDNSQDPPAKNESDYFFNISYNDEAEIIASVKAFDVAGIATIGTNDAICVAARLNKRLGLNGFYDKPAVIERATYKHLFKDYLLEKGIQVPSGKSHATFQRAKQTALELSFPVILKPSDGSGSKGISVVVDEKKMSKAFSSAMSYARNKKVVVEKYIGNNSYAVESFVVNKRILYTLIAERQIPSPPHCGGKGLTIPAALPEKTHQRMKNLSMRAITELGLCNGPVHMDMVLTDAGQPNIVDIGPRLIAGPCGWEGIFRISGFDPVDAVLDQALGELSFKDSLCIRDSLFFAHRYITFLKTGVLRKIKPDQSLYNNQIKSVVLFTKPGDNVFKFENASHRYGYVTAVAESYREVCRVIEDFIKHIYIEIE